MTSLKPKRSCVTSPRLFLIIESTLFLVADPKSDDGDDDDKNDGLVP